YPLRLELRRECAQHQVVAQLVEPRQQARRALVRPELAEEPRLGDAADHDRPADAGRLQRVDHRIELARMDPRDRADHARGRRLPGARKSIRYARSSAASVADVNPRRRRPTTFRPRSRARSPAATQNGGTSIDTIAPAAHSADSPIRTNWCTPTSPPMMAWSSIVTCPPSAAPGETIT